MPHCDKELGNIHFDIVKNTASVGIYYRLAVNHAIMLALNKFGMVWRVSTCYSTVVRSDIAISTYDFIGRNQSVSNTEVTSSSVKLTEKQL